MKKIGLNINIGVNASGVNSKLQKTTKSIGRVGATIDKLNRKKISIINNDLGVKKISRQFDTVQKRIDRFKNQKITLQTKLGTAKTKREIDALNAKIAKTSRVVTALNGNKLKLKGQLTAAKNEANATNRAVGKIKNTIDRINSTKLKIQQTVDRREKFKRNIVGNVARVAAVGMPIRTGIQFESSMARVKALTMAVGLDFKRLTNTALDLGSSTTFSSSQVAQGMQFLSMAGFKVNDTIKAMPGMLNLASAGAVDLGVTSDIASNILSGFKMEAVQMGRVANVMAKTITSSNTTVQELGDTMKYAGTPARALGDSFETVSAMAGKLGDIGIKSSQAGTSLRTMYLRMASPPTEAVKSMKKLGLKTKDAKGNFVGMVNILTQLNKKTKGMGDTVKADYMKKLFGTEAISAALELTSQADGTLQKYIETLKKADKQNFAAKMAKIQNATTAGALKKLGSAVEGISIKFATIFTPAITVAADKLANVSSWIGAMMDKYPRLTQAITVGGAALLAGGVAFGALGVAVGFATNGMRMLSLAFMTNPIGLAVAGIALAAGLIIAYWEPISGFFSGIWNNIGTGFKEMWTGVKTAIGFNPVTVISEKWNAVWDFLSNFSLRDAGAKIIDSLIAGIEAKWEALKAKVGAVAKSVRDFFPFSPAKTGALRDIHRIKLMETIAGGLNERPLLQAVNNTTKKVRRTVGMAGVGLALGGTLAAASPLSTTSNVQSVMSGGTITSPSMNMGRKQEVQVHFNGGITIQADAQGQLDTSDFQEQIAQAVKDALQQVEDEKQTRMYD